MLGRIFRVGKEHEFTSTVLYKCHIGYTPRRTRMEVKKTFSGSTAALDPVTMTSADALSSLLGHNPLKHCRKVVCEVCGEDWVLL